jgi:hypothetical protein
MAGLVTYSLFWGGTLLSFSFIDEISHWTIPLAFILSVSDIHSESINPIDIKSTSTGIPETAHFGKLEQLNSTD